MWVTSSLLNARRYDAFGFHDLFLLGFSVDETSICTVVLLFFSRFSVELWLLLLISPGEDLRSPGCLEQEMKKAFMNRLYNGLS